MAASPGVTRQIDQLIELFNLRSMDLPDGLFTRQTQFVLNGVPFEERLGRSPSDPLVLMLARGPAGYRFAGKAVQHAVPDATLQRGELAERDEEGLSLVTGEGWLSGHFRGTGHPTEILIAFELRMRGAAATRMAATLSELALAELQEARLRS